MTDGPTNEPAGELLRILPNLAVALYQAAPHEHLDAAAAGGTSLTRRQMDAAMELATRGRSTMTELAEALGVSKAAATEMVERLVAKGLVRRDASASDRRVVVVELTDDAQVRADRWLALGQAQLVHVFDRFPDVAPATLVEFLTALTDELKETSRV